MGKTRKNSSNLVSLRQSGILARVAAGETISSIARDTGLSQRRLYAIAERSSDIIGDAVAEAHSRSAPGCRDSSTRP